MKYDGLKTTFTIVKNLGKLEKDWKTRDWLKKARNAYVHVMKENLITLTFTNGSQIIKSLTAMH